MDTMKAQLQALLEHGLSWEGRIRKSSYSDRVEFTVEPNGEFSVTATWSTRSGSTQSYTKTYTRDLVFGPTSSRSPNPRILRRRCAYFTDFIREVLQQRGVA